MKKMDLKMDLKTQDTKGGYRDVFGALFRGCIRCYHLPAAWADWSN